MSFEAERSSRSAWNALANVVRCFGPRSYEPRGIIGDGSEFRSLPWNAPQQKSLPSPFPSPFPIRALGSRAAHQLENACGNAIGRAILKLRELPTAPAQRTFLMISSNATRLRTPRPTRILAALSVFAWLVSPPTLSDAADNLWIGGAANGNFSDNGNWQSPPSWGYGNSLVFKLNTNAPTLINDGSWQNNNDIFWDATFPVARTLESTGDFGLGFKVRLENLSSFTQTVTMPLSGGLDNAGQIQINPVNGSLILSGTLYNDNSVDYAVFGSQTATVTNLTLNSPLGPNATQTNVDFVVAAGRNTAVEVNAGQLWAGTTDVQSGSFTTGNGVTLASTAILVSGGTVATTSANTFADLATLTVNTGRLSLGGSDTVGSLAGSGGAVVLASAATLTAGGANSSTSYAGSISGSGGLTKLGSGTFTLSGSNTYTGATAVNAGTLLVNGSLGNTTVTVNAAGLLGGSGTILGDVTVASSGTLSPGNSPGVLTVESLSLLAGSHTAMEITGTAAGLYDQIIGVGTGGLTYGGNLDLVLSGSYADQTTFHLFSNFSSPSNGDFSAVGLNATGEYAGLTFTGTDGVWTSTWTTNQQRLVFSTGTGDLVVVPEPSAYAMALAGLACGGWQMWRRRRLRQAAPLAA
jgi:autotransporter-associated beta strand protein